MLPDKRRVSLDLLRGTMAIVILTYHYVGWTGYELIYPFDDLLDRLGIYAVSVFFILSGYGLALGYAGKPVTVQFIKRFYKKRILKIAPLFYIATLLTVAINYFYFSPPDTWTLFTNFSLIFGWVDPSGYMATGTWYIGNQLVYYSLFPFMLLLANKSIRHYLVFFLASLVSAVYFPFNLLNESFPLSDQWSVYINPLNNLFFFAGGSLIGLLYKQGKLSANETLMKGVFLASILVLTFFPVSGSNQISYVVGLPRMLFSVTMFMMTISLIFIKVNQKNVLISLLQTTSDLSYSIYLFHPIAYTIMQIVFDKKGISNSSILVAASLVLTIIMSFAGTFIEERISKEKLLKGRIP